jgi:hypothetical protein
VFKFGAIRNRESVYKRGVIIVRGMVPKDEVDEIYEVLKEYLRENGEMKKDHTPPGANKPARHYFNVYWSKAQVKTNWMPHIQIIYYVRINLYLYPIGHEDSVGLSVCKVHISATRWRFYT